MAATSAADSSSPLVTVELSGARTLHERILAAAPRCIARWGLGKTTLDDLAREAGCSRASIYRLFPGGKDHVLFAALVYEEARLFAELAPALEAAESVEDLLVTGLVGGARFIDGNDALQYLMDHEPEAVLPHIAFDRVGPMLHRVSGFAGPYLERFLSPDEAVEVAQWATRLLLSYTLRPSEHVDLREPADARRFVQTFVLPALTDLPARPPSSDIKGEPHVIH